MEKISCKNSSSGYQYITQIETKYGFRKEVMALPLTFTFHVWKFTVTITIRNTHRQEWSKDRNEKNCRHSGK